MFLHGNSVAYATVFPSYPDIWAIIKALEEIKNAFPSKCILFTDSLSCLQALLYMKLEHIANKDIIFYGYPAIFRGNEKADSAAKSALDLPRVKVGVLYSDFKHLISQYIFSTWQDDWNGAVANKLHLVKPVLGDWQSFYKWCRKDEVVLCRSRIRHTYLTHSYILKKDPPPRCEHCQCILTVRHILVECNRLARTRNDIFGRCGVVESFQFHPELVLKC